MASAPYRMAKFNPGEGPRMAAQITTVSPSTKKIEARLKDKGEIQISLFDIPPLFVWPKEGEYWIVRKDGNYWKLINRYENNDDHKVTDLNPGEAKIGSDVLKSHTGSTFLNITKDNVIQMGEVQMIVGQGSPEGSQEAPVGSMYTRTDGSAGSTLYVKTSGAGNTGWNALG